MSNDDRSRLVRDLQKQNIYCICMTFPVSNDDRSRLVRDSQLENILSICVTFSVLTFERSTLTSPSHPQKDKASSSIGVTKLKDFNLL